MHRDALERQKPGARGGRQGAGTRQQSRASTSRPRPRAQVAKRTRSAPSEALPQQQGGSGSAQKEGDAPELADAGRWRVRKSPNRSLALPVATQTAAAGLLGGGRARQAQRRPRASSVEKGGDGAQESEFGPRRCCGAAPRPCLPRWAGRRPPARAPLARHPQSVALPQRQGGSGSAQKEGDRALGRPAPSQRCTGCEEGVWEGRHRHGHGASGHSFARHPSSAASRRHACSRVRERRKEIFGDKFRGIGNIGLMYLKPYWRENAQSYREGTGTGQAIRQQGKR